MPQEDQNSPPGAAHRDWFRQPTPREHRLGGWLFIGFGLFFILFYFVERDSGFRWVILGLGVVSILRAGYHWVRARRSSELKR